MCDLEPFSKIQSHIVNINFHKEIKQSTKMFTLQMNHQLRMIVSRKS